MRNGDAFSPAVLERIASLLDEFGGGSSLTLTELAERADLPRSSVHRLLAQLLESGWVVRHGNTYSLSRAMIGWGALAQQTDRLYRAAHPVLHELHASTGLVVHLGVLEGPDVRYLDKVGRSAVTVPTRVGGRQPALRTALGKAMLAHAGATQTALPAVPAQTTRADAALRQEFARIRLNHVAHESEQSLPGIACVAAPIGDRQVCVAAVSLTGAVGAVDPTSLSTPLRAAAHAIWTSLGRDARAVAEPAAAF